MESRRRDRRVENLGLLELLFRCYVVAIAAGVALFVLSRWLGGPPVDATGVARVAEHGPGALGVLFGGVLVAGARTGRRGGPVTVEHAMVRHVLLAPIHRLAALRPVLLAHLRFAVLLGALLGGAAGLFAAQRLPGAVAPWTAVGAATGATVALLYVAVGLCVAGWRLHRAGALVAGGLTAGTAVSLWRGAVVDPLSGLATLVLAPVHELGVAAAWLWAPVGGALVAAVAAGALTGVSRVPVEVLERRGRLVSVLRFSITMRDLRAVVLFRRRLAGETSRARPWLHLPPGRRWPVWWRGWHGALRWPALRWGRVAALGVTAAYATAAAVTGPQAVVIVAAAAQFVLAVEATEALAEDADHPTLRHSYPIPDSRLWLRHLWPASVIVAAAGTLGVLALVPVAGSGVLAAIPTVLPGAVLACAVAGWVAVREPMSADVLLMDVQGVAQGMHVLGPVAIGGFAPISIVATIDPAALGPWVQPAATTTALAVLAVGWLAARASNGVLAAGFVGLIPAGRRP